MMKKYQYITPREAPMIKDLAPNVCAVYTEEEMTRMYIHR